jgi:hypothetical protein
MTGGVICCCELVRDALCTSEQAGDWYEEELEWYGMVWYGMVS